MEDESAMREARAELAALKAQRSRAVAACPIRYFTTKDRPHQTPFFHDEHAITGVSAGRGAGKTLCPMARAMAAATGIEPLALPGMLAILPKPPIRVRIWCMDLVRMIKNVIKPYLIGLAPPKMLDTSRGTDGFNEKSGTLYLTNGSEFEAMSYELRSGKGESAEKEIVICDEIPPYQIYAGQKLRILRAREQWFYMWIVGTRSGDAMPWNVQWFEDDIVRCGPDGIGAISHHEFNSEECLAALANERDDPSAFAARQAAVIDTLTDEEKAVFIGGGSDRTTLTVYPGYSDRQNAYCVPGVSADMFPKLAKEGYGEIWAGGDHGHGTTGATALVYVFLATKDVREIQIAKGDYIQFAEYYRKNARVITNLGPLQALHRQFKPKGYFLDKHAWDHDAAMVGMCPAMLYSDPKRLRDITCALHPDVDKSGFDLTPITPLYPAKNTAGSLDAGIQIVAGMLRPRQGEVDWSRYRIQTGTSPMTTKSFRGWQRKRNPETGLPGDKYSKYLKDVMDAVRYLLMANPAQFEAESESTSVNVPFDSFSGVAYSQLCSLSGGIPGGLQ